VYSDTAVYLTKGGATADRLTVNPTTGGNAFHTTEDLRQLMQWQLGDSTSSTSSTGIKVSMNSAGEFEINNQNGINSLNIAITSIHNSAASSVTANKLFTATMQGLAGTSTKGVAATKTSLSLNAATHGSGIDVFDSLGSKHTISFTFVKVANGTSSSGPEWQWTATAPLPADLGGDQFSPNLYVGDSGQPNTIRFGQDGAILDYSPKKLNVSFNNGSAPNQTVSLNWGTSGAFDGLSSYDAASATSLISQDGYTGGDLQDIRIDQNGVLVGSFTNGISYGLAQVALAKFSNNEGLMAEGGNIYSMSSNSGAPTIGTASTGGRGAIASSALETSNVDLSRSLTELIVIQRGYQANSKTITTSDQMLQVLLSLKQ
jgi:flagellar hook protein FlgE